MNAQREFFFPRLIEVKRAPKDVIDGFTCYRDAVVWSWKNRGQTSGDWRVDQAAFANLVGMHSPHMSRCVNPDTKAPMNLDPDYVAEFERVTGWKAVTQWECKTRNITPMEWVLEDRRTA